MCEISQPAMVRNREQQATLNNLTHTSLIPLMEAEALTHRYATQARAASDDAAAPPFLAFCPGALVEQATFPCLPEFVLRPCNGTQCVQALTCTEHTRLCSRIHDYSTHSLKVWVKLRGYGRA